MLFHKFHFICCDVVDDPTGKEKERLSWVSLDSFSFANTAHPVYVSVWVRITALKWTIRPALPLAAR
jgi:hypothetical protein